MGNGREASISAMEETIKQYESEGILEEEVLEEPTFSENIGAFWGSMRDMFRSEVNRFQLWQRTQGERGANYIKEMRKLSGQKPYDETGR